MGQVKKSYNPKNKKHAIQASIGILLIIFGFVFGILVIAGSLSNRLNTSSLTAPELFMLTCLLPITFGYWLIRILTASSKAALRVIVNLLSSGF